MLPSGEQIAIAHGDERAVISEVGATLRTFVKGGLAVIEGFAGEEVPTGARGQVLYPWPTGWATVSGRSRIGRPDRPLTTSRTPPRSMAWCVGGPFASIR